MHVSRLLRRYFLPCAARLWIQTSPPPADTGLVPEQASTLLTHWCVGAVRPPAWTPRNPSGARKLTTPISPRRDELALPVLHRLEPELRRGRIAPHRNRRLAVLQLLLVERLRPTHGMSAHEAKNNTKNAMAKECSYRVRTQPLCVPATAWTDSQSPCVGLDPAGQAHSAAWTPTIPADTERRLRRHTSPSEGTQTPSSQT